MTMDGSWRVIDLAAVDGELRSCCGGIEVHLASGGVQIVPVADVAVVLIGLQVVLSASVLHRLYVQANVRGSKYIKGIGD